MIANVYVKGLEKSGSHKFVNFTDQTVQTYYRLKLRYIENKMKNGLPSAIADNPSGPHEHTASLESRILKFEKQLEYISDINGLPPVLSTKSIDTTPMMKAL